MDALRLQPFSEFLFSDRGNKLIDTLSYGLLVCVADRVVP